jgi:thioesterase domain-containing protein
MYQTINAESKLELKRSRLSPEKRLLLEKHMRGEITSAPPGKGPLPGETQPGVVVPIKPHGRKKPFFCLPGVGGNAIYLYNLAPYFNIDQPLYGLTSQTLDNESTLQLNVAEMARFYVDTLYNIQPEGPYFLGGHSFGGIVAFEMAQIIQRDGKAVGLLIIIDQKGPQQKDSRSITSQENDIHLLMSIAREIEHVYRKKLGITAGVLSELKDEDERLDYLVEQIFVNIFPVDGVKGAIRYQLKNQLTLIKNHIKALDSYHPGNHISMPIILIRAKEHDATVEESENVFGGWEKYSDGNVAVDFVDGDHYSIMREPNVRQLASKIQHYIHLNQAG